MVSTLFHSTAETRQPLSGQSLRWSAGGRRQPGQFSHGDLLTLCPFLVELLWPPKEPDSMERVPILPTTFRSCRILTLILWQPSGLTRAPGVFGCRLRNLKIPSAGSNVISSQAAHATGIIPCQ